MVREGRDQGEGGELLAIDSKSSLNSHGLQIELEQILGLNQDLAPSAPTSYITADVPSKVQKVSAALQLWARREGVGRNIVPISIQFVS